MTKIASEADSKFIEAEENAVMDFQFAILDAMKDKGVSQADLAGMLGVSRARVSQLLSSEANPTLKLVGRALTALGLKADYCVARRIRKDGEGVASERFGRFDVEMSVYHAVQISSEWAAAECHTMEEFIERLPEAA